MRTRTLAAIALMFISVALPQAAHALYDTPRWDRGLVFDLLRWDPKYKFAGLDSAYSAMVSQGYTTVRVDQDTLSSDSLVTVRIVDLLQEPFGAYSMYSHGLHEEPHALAGLPGVQYFRGSDIQGWTNAIEAGVDAGMDPTEFSGTQISVVYYDSLNVPVDTVAYLATYIDTLGLQRVSKPRDAVMHLQVCSGADLYRHWTTSGTATLAGYSQTCYAGPSSADARHFWGNLHGFAGRTNRTVYASKVGTGLTLFPDSHSGDSVVLAPWIIDVFPPRHETPPYDITTTPELGYVQFDTKMHAAESDADLAVGLDSTYLWFFSYTPDATPVWDEGPDYSFLEWKMYPLAKGTSAVTIYGSHLRSDGGILLNTGNFELPPHAFVKGDTLTYVYRVLGGIGAIALDRVSAETGVGGNTIRWSTSWEQYADSFRVERVAGPAGPDLPKIAAGGGPSSYQLFDSYGDGTSRYRLIEEQTPPRLDLEYDIFDAGPLHSPLPSDPASFDPDSLVGELETSSGFDSTEFAQSIGVEIGPVYRLIAPDTLVSSLGVYRALWWNQNVTTSVTSMSEVEAAGGLVPYITWAYDQGTRYVLLVGDANDAAWWDDESRWVNGWHYPRLKPGGPHHPSQPERNLIPTTYTADVDSPRVAMSFYTPYYASDLPYADVNGDGMPDMRIGRLPVDSRADLIAYTSKLSAYLQTTPASTPKNVLMTYARNNGGVIGKFVEGDAESVEGTFPVGAVLGRVTDTEATKRSFAERLAVADSVTATSPDRIWWIASGAQRDIYGNYWRLDQKWAMDSLAIPSPPGRLFVSMGFSCGMGNFDQTENYVACDTLGTPVTCADPIRPIPERLLLSPNRGAIAVIGPTRGSYQTGNVYFAREMVRQLAVAGRDLGTAFMVAQAACLTKHSEYRDLFRSYVLLGDPVIGGPILTGVANVPAVPRVGLGKPRPNPFNPLTILPVTLASPGRVSLSIYDVRGRLVRVLVRNEVLKAGTTPVAWNGRNQQGGAAGSGIYFARMTHDGKSYNRKLVMLK